MFGNNSDSDSEEVLLTQALPVSDFKNVDLALPPNTGEEYLYRVRLEASKCPDVVVATNIDVKKFEIKRSCLVEVLDVKTDEVSQELLPTVEWQRKKCVEFSNLRLQIDKKRSEFVGSQKKKFKKHKFPKLDDTDGWYEFCYGKKDEQVEVQGSTSTNEQASQFQEPLLSLLYNMEQSAILQLLDYQIDWFEEKGYSEEMCKWIYSLMAFVEKPLLGETYSTLRRLARVAIDLRSKTDKNDETKLTTLNLIVSLVGRYFEQLDLVQ